MKKKWIAVMLAICVAAITGCGSKTVKTGNKQLEEAVYNDDSISLAEYTGLGAEKKIYKVTEEAVAGAVQEQLEEYAEYKTVARASKTGDNVYVDYTAKAGGKVLDQEENYYFTLGDEEFGAAFDEQLTGVSKGEQLQFSLEFDQDFGNDAFAGQTVVFEITVGKIETEILPEMTSEFLKQNFGYDTYDQFRASVQTQVEQEYEAESTDQLQEDLLKQVIDASSVLQYTQEEYDEAAETVDSFYAEYAEMFGQDMETIYDTFEVTEESLEEEIMDELYRRIVVDAIIKNEQLTLNDEEYESGIAYYMEQNEYTSREEFVNDYGEDEIQERLLEDKVLQLLEQSAKVTQIEADYEG